MPKIVIAANVFESNKKLGALVVFLSLLTLAAYIASQVVSPSVFTVGFYTATDVLLVVFYTVAGIFVLFLVIYLVKSGVGKKIYDYIKSGKLKETVEKVKSFAKKVGEEFPELKGKVEKMTKTSSGESKKKVASPLEVIEKLGSLFGSKSQASPNRVFPLQVTPAEGPAIVVVPKTRAPVEDVPRVAFLGHQRRNGGKLAVLIVSINLLLVLTIILALFLTGIWMWGI